MAYKNIRLKDLGQLIFMPLKGTELLASEKKFILKHDIGGVSLFARNLKHPQQILRLCTQVRDLGKQQTHKQPLFIGIDMEGGRVNRLPRPFTHWPPMRLLATHPRATYVAHGLGQLMGEELHALGINLNYAPCADVDTYAQNPVIGDRAFDQDPAKVGRLARAVAKGLQSAGIVPCAKHFPGHGNTRLDSHWDLPVESTRMALLKKRELKAFAALMQDVHFFMTAHIVFKHCDPKWPASLSRFFIDELRKMSPNEKLVITDDLGMGALTKWPLEERSVQALRAGSDVLLFCNDFSAPLTALKAIKDATKKGTLSPSTLLQKRERLLDFKTQHLSYPKLSYSRWKGARAIKNSLRSYEWVQRVFYSC